MSSDVLFIVLFFFFYLISWNCFLIDYRSEKRAQILSYNERLPSRYEVGIGECVECVFCQSLYLLVDLITQGGQGVMTVTWYVILPSKFVEKI